jgi:hypothetical protein
MKSIVLFGVVTLLSLGPHNSLHLHAPNLFLHHMKINMADKLIHMENCSESVINKESTKMLAVTSV